MNYNGSELEFLEDLDSTSRRVDPDSITTPPFQRVAADRAHRLGKRLPFNQALAPPVDLYEEPDRTLISLNGAGRQWLAQQSGVEAIDARVFSVKYGRPPLTDRQKQLLCEVLNAGVDSYTNSDKFDARLVVTLEPETTIAKTLADAGLPWKKRKEEGYFFSAHIAYVMWTDGLNSEWKATPEFLLKRDIEIMVAAYGQLGDANNPQVAAGVSKILRVNGSKVDPVRLADIIKKNGGAVQLLFKAGDSRNGNGAGPRVADHLIRQYNKKLPAGMRRLTYVATALKKKK